MNAHSTKNRRPFIFPLTFDPLRILHGIRRHWLWFIFFPVLFLFIGVQVGMKLTHDRYSVSLQLLRTRLPNLFTVNPVGDSFKPRSLDDETLLATTYTTQVLTSTARKFEPQRSIEEIKDNVEVTNESHTDFFYLTAYSYRSPQDAIDLVSGWANSIINFTRALQRGEALDMVRFLESQISQLSAQQSEVDKEILKFAEVEKFVDENLQVESTLAALENLRITRQLEEMSLTSKRLLIQRYEDEIRQQSPIASQLKTKRDELTFLKGRYTEANPLVREKLFEIENLEKQLAQSEDAPTPLSEYTGSPLGDQLYLEILALRGEIAKHEQSISDLDTLISQRGKDVERLPQKQLILQQLKSRRSHLLGALVILRSRLQEAQFFTTNSPGYLRIFQQPNLSDVETKTKVTKAALLGSAGIVAGILVAGVFSAIWEFTNKGLRTPLQLCAAAQSALVLRFYTGQNNEKSLLPNRRYSEKVIAKSAQALREFWLTELIGSDGNPKPSAFISSERVENEIAFWDGLFAQAESLNIKPILIECSEEEEGLDTQVSGSCFRCENIENLDTFLAKEKEAGRPLLFRITGLPTPRLNTLIASAVQYFGVNEVSRGAYAETSSFYSIYRKRLGHPNGIIISDKPPKRAIDRLIHWAEFQFFKYRNTYAAKSDINPSTEGTL